MKILSSDTRRRREYLQPRGCSNYINRRLQSHNTATWSLSLHLTTTDHNSFLRRLYSYSISSRYVHAIYSSRSISTRGSAQRSACCCWSSAVWSQTHIFTFLIPFRCQATSILVRTWPWRLPHSKEDRLCCQSWSCDNKAALYRFVTQPRKQHCFIYLQYPYLISSYSLCYAHQTNSLPWKHFIVFSLILILRLSISLSYTLCYTAGRFINLLLSLVSLHNYQYLYHHSFLG